MKINKIEIKTVNKKHATDIAMLVDKTEFLKELQRLREKWNIMEFIDPTRFNVFLDLKIYTKAAKPETARLRFAEFKNDIFQLLRKFKRGVNFKPVIEYALVSGVIPEGAYKSCYFDIVPIGEYEDLDKPENYQYVIVMSPRTEKQEVEQVYEDFQEYIRGYEPNNEYETGSLGKINFHRLTNLDANVREHKDLIEQYIKGSVYFSADITKFKSLKELGRTREWYWIKYEDCLNGKTNKPLTHSKVLDKWQENNCPVRMDHPDEKDRRKCPFCSIEDVTLVNHALADYDKLLQKS